MAESTVLKQPEPLCTACKHCRLAAGVVELTAYCVSPKNEWGGLVAGDVRPCFVARYLGGCGAAGQWFEPRD